MPALDNPRWERFAQAIVEGLANGDRKPYSQGRAYIAAGYTAQGMAAEVCASKLLKKVKPILDRVRELQAEANKRLEPKLDISRETIGKRLRIASKMAEDDRNPAAMATCELGMAKVFHHVSDNSTAPQDFNGAESMQDIGRKLLQSIGFREPDDASISEAVETNDRFIDELQAIHQRAQALMLEQQ
jgi:hypothetical protein